MTGHAISMSDLAKDLRPHAGRIVVDKTGLNELFDVDLKFTSEDSSSTTASGSAAAEPPRRSAAARTPLPVAVASQCARGAARTETGIRENAHRSSDH